MFSLMIRGHVRAPTFEFSLQEIDFGKCSYLFEEVKEISLVNISNVPFEFNLKIPGDGNQGNKEFEIIPKIDQIKSGETKKI